MDSSLAADVLPPIRIPKRFGILHRLFHQAKNDEQNHKNSRGAPNPVSRRSSKAASISKSRSRTTTAVECISDRPKDGGEGGSGIHVSRDPGSAILEILDGDRHHHHLVSALPQCISDRTADLGVSGRTRARRISVTRAILPRHAPDPETRSGIIKVSRAVSVSDARNEHESAVAADPGAKNRPELKRKLKAKIKLVRPPPADVTKDPAWSILELIPDPPPPPPAPPPPPPVVDAEIEIFNKSNGFENPTLTDTCKSLLDEIAKSLPAPDLSPPRPAAAASASRWAPLAHPFPASQRPRIREGSRPPPPPAARNPFQAQHYSNANGNTHTARYLGHEPTRFQTREDEVAWLEKAVFVKDLELGMETIRQDYIQRRMAEVEQFYVLLYEGGNVVPRRDLVEILDSERTWLRRENDKIARRLHEESENAMHFRTRKRALDDSARMRIENREDDRRKRMRLSSDMQMQLDLEAEARGMLGNGFENLYAM